MSPNFNINKRSGYTGVPLIFRLFLFFGFIVIALVFVYYTQNVVGQLKANSLRMVNLSIKLLQVELSQETSGEATGVIFDEIIAPTEIPIIITDRNNNPLFFRNIQGLDTNVVTDENREKLVDRIGVMNEKYGRFPIKHIDQETGTETIINYFYYGDPQLIQQLQAMPFIEIGIVAAFLLLGYIGYRNIKRSEQHFIWVGMAKETAHQLGTPISSLMGWLEILNIWYDEEKKAGVDEDELNQIEDVAQQMTRDIERLQKIANRFSQIGSRPALKKADLNQIIEDVVEYFRERLPYQGKGITINFNPDKIDSVRINSELIGWVIENLIKNSLEACDPMTGRITISTAMSQDKKMVTAEFSDNGKGIPAGGHKKIFHPGFTSKKRGWGLGLSLAKRIIEEYHDGHIGVKSSIPNKETVIQFFLPAEKNGSEEDQTG
ncbi:MAG: HAMP domain-containing histidine kinase [candidate division Zixibacteria bacterium]|nr:HAMP domain-containing histidine kinase [candidate division Zixibacteria bacterium]NIT54204.1 HAMP domain-containing histidine kinase [candidate division Zixibacteria bacterium]NIW42719.1 GHKL domain-containing protein [candidate division Zixibacteria bacterium]NIX59816.1 GHKL domain-containing protein [candidate division Zixibacteria bacterium]